MHKTCQLLHIPAACHNPLINSRWEEFRVTSLEKNVTLIYHQKAICNQTKQLNHDADAFNPSGVGLFACQPCAARSPQEERLRSFSHYTQSQSGKNTERRLL